MAFDLKRMSYILWVTSVIFKDRDRELSYQKVTKIKVLLLGVLKNITGFESTQQIVFLSVRELFALTKILSAENEWNIRESRIILGI